MDREEQLVGDVHDDTASVGSSHTNQLASLLQCKSSNESPQTNRNEPRS